MTSRCREATVQTSRGACGARSQPVAIIDHRRVPILKNKNKHTDNTQPKSTRSTDYLPGDLVTWNLGGNVLHIGISSDRRAGTGVPLVIHNICAGTQEEDVLFHFAIVGHYRL